MVSGVGITKDLRSDFWNLGTAFNKIDQRNYLIQPAVCLNEYMLYTKHIAKYIIISLNSHCNPIRQILITPFYR